MDSPKKQMIQDPKMLMSDVLDNMRERHCRQRKEKVVIIVTMIETK